MENILEKIKDIRKQKGFSHEYMAHKLDMSQPAYSKIEKNETVLSVDRLFKIAEILETPVNDILELNHYGLEVHRFGWQTKSLHGC